VRNSEIAELLARAAEHAKQPLQRGTPTRSTTFLSLAGRGRRHARSGAEPYELAGIGPYLNKQIIDWLTCPPDLEEAIPEIRQNFLTLAEARTLRSKYPELFHEIRGDLQMHTLWSDGSGSVQDMAEAARSRGYSYIAITHHSKGLKIAAGIDEGQLGKQGVEIAAVNESMRRNAAGFRVLRAVELNLSPTGTGDMDQAALDRLDLVLGCFHSALRRKEDRRNAILPPYVTLQFTYLAIPEVASTTFALAEGRLGS
jgi:hypothetical protein